MKRHALFAALRATISGPETSPKRRVRSRVWRGGPCGGALVAAARSEAALHKPTAPPRVLQSARSSIAMTWSVFGSRRDAVDVMGCGGVSDEQITAAVAPPARCSSGGPRTWWPSLSVTKPRWDDLQTEQNIRSK